MNGWRLEKLVVSSWRESSTYSHLKRKGEAKHKRITEESQDACARDVCTGPVNVMICAETPHPALPADGGRKLLQRIETR